jgi:hypothetical protein
MKTLIDTRARLADRRGAATSPGVAPQRWRPKARRCRLGRVTAGFWLGAALLGTAGCLLGASMPCRHPVALASSAAWWGIYLGCLGASVGALAGLGTGRPVDHNPDRVP